MSTADTSDAFDAANTATAAFLPSEDASDERAAAEIGLLTLLFLVSCVVLVLGFAFDFVAPVPAPAWKLSCCCDETAPGPEDVRRGGAIVLLIFLVVERCVIVVLVMVVVVVVIAVNEEVDVA